MKDPVRHQKVQPVTQCTCFLFVHRNWRRQEANLFTCSSGRYWPPATCYLTLYSGSGQGQPKNWNCNPPVPFARIVHLFTWQVRPPRERIMRRKSPAHVVTAHLSFFSLLKQTTSCRIGAGFVQVSPVPLAPFGRALIDFPMNPSTVPSKKSGKWKQGCLMNHKDIKGLINIPRQENTA